MNVREAMILGICIVVGLGLHGYLSRPDQPAARPPQKEPRSEVKASLDLSPKVLKVGDDSLLFIPHFDGDRVNWYHSFFRLEKGALKKVEKPE
jgi:hypothetical protein